MSDLSDANLLPRKEAVPGGCSLTIDEVCRVVRSGDLVLFSGASWTSWFVTLFCASQWSHIGIVYREPDGEPLLFESIKTDDDGSPNIDCAPRSIESAFVSSVCDSSSTASPATQSQCARC